MKNEIKFIKSIFVNELEFNEDDIDTLNWGFILEYALNHKVIGGIYVYLDERNLLSKLSPFICESLRYHRLINESRYETIIENVISISNLLVNNGIPHAFLKGTILYEQLYEPGTRYLGDIDILIDDSNSEQVQNLLLANGLEFGYIHRSTGTMRSLSRRDLLGYKLTPDHLPPILLETNNKFLNYVQVDVSLCMTWSRHPIQLDIKELIDNFVPFEVSNEKLIPALTKPLHLIYVCFHFLREASSKIMIMHHQALNLIKYIDIYKLWSVMSQVEKDEFFSLINVYGLKSDVYWVLCELERELGVEVFPSYISEYDLSNVNFVNDMERV